MNDEEVRNAIGSKRAPGSADPFGAAVRATRMPMIICDALAPDIPIMFANGAFLASSGYSEAEVLGRNCRFLQGADTDRETVARIREAVHRHEDVHAELLNYRRDGSTFWNALFVGPVRDDEGVVRYFFGSQMDVTARKEAELRIRAEKAAIEAAVTERTQSLQVALDARNALLHEVDHRVKNNLQTIAALVAMESRGVTDPAGRDAFTRLMRRVEAIATVHRRLYEADAVDRFDVAGFAHALLDQLGASLGALVVPRIDAEPILVPASQASPIALMLNELLIEAAASGVGTVNVSVGRVDAARFAIRIGPMADEGSVTADAGSKGVGLASRLVRQLRGEMQRGGGEVRISIPCDGRPG